MVHDPVERGHDKYNSFIQFQLRADTSCNKILILLLYLAVQLDLRTVTTLRILNAFKMHLEQTFKLH